MEFLEAVQICDRWDHQFFPGPAQYRLLVWDHDDIYLLCVDVICHREETDLWGSGRRMGFNYMYRDLYRRDPASVIGDHRAIHSEDLYGSKT